MNGDLNMMHTCVVMESCNVKCGIILQYLIGSIESEFVYLYWCDNNNNNRTNDLTLYTQQKEQEGCANKQRHLHEG